MIQATVVITTVLDESFWGIDEMLKEYHTSEVKKLAVLDLIKEDWLAIIEDGKIEIKLKVIG